MVNVPVFTASFHLISGVELGTAENDADKFVPSKDRVLLFESKRLILNAPAVVEFLPIVEPIEMDVLLVVPEVGLWEQLPVKYVCQPINDGGILQHWVRYSLD